MALSLVALFEKFPHELAAVKWFEDQRCGRCGTERRSGCGRTCW